MYRLKGSFPKHSLKLLYTVLLSPYLHYCTVVWAGGHWNGSIHILQRRAVRIICGAHYFAKSAPLFKSLGLLKIHDIYEVQLAIGLLMYQHHAGTLPHLFKAYFVTHVETHSYNTRHKLNYRYEVARTK